MIELAHCVSAYEHLGDELHPWLESARGAIERGRFEEHSTQEILDYLFFTCRADRHGGDGSVYREPWFVQAANEVRRRFLAGRDPGTSQEQTLKAPAAVPHRPRKDPRDIKLLDPASGSGHFLLYGFDLMLEIYREAWEDESSPASEATGKTLRDDYPTRDALDLAIPGLILRHNLHGIDIDPRCAQIAALALWMRAQRALNDFGITRDRRPAIRKTNVVVAEPMPGEREMLHDFLRSLREDRLESLIRKTLEIPEARRVRATKAMADSLCQLVQTVWEKMKLAGEAGSLLKIEEELASGIERGRDEWEEKLPLFRVTEYGIDGGASDTYYRHVPGVDDDFWDRAETLTVHAIEEYVAVSRGEDHFRRRMFAEDATRGFAFIDVCRKRYDIVLMNPPFGAGSLAAKRAFEKSYPRTKNDLYAAFVERGVQLSHKRGRLGAITSRTGFFLSSFQRWREEILLKEASPVVFADLGSGVLDGAMVEVAAYCLEVTA
jgi:hypothetical protein